MDRANIRSVRRSELHSSSAESTPDPELQRLFAEQLTKQKGEPNETYESSQIRPQQEPQVPEQEQDEGVEFRLFAPSSAHPDGIVSRIRVKSPESTNELVIIPRPDSYYFASELSAAQNARFSYSAVSGDEVLSRSRTPWPGCHMPWRVITISSFGKVVQRLNKPISVGSEDGVQRKRKRKGKKARVAIRKKMAADQERAAREGMSKGEREIQEKIKRAKRNHEKKVKQRERNKRKKAQVATAIGGALCPNQNEPQPDVNPGE